jgi:hypothetical protein
MKRMLYTETTEIAAQKTAGEITDLLVRHGATGIALEYRDQKIVGLKSAFPVKGIVVPFFLPGRVEPVFKVLNGRRAKESWRRGSQQQMAAKDRDQAERVAWRQLLRWVQAQVAMIDTGTVETVEVFMPYIHGRHGRTLFEEFKDSGMKKMLPAPEE